MKPIRNATCATSSCLTWNRRRFSSRNLAISAARPAITLWSEVKGFLFLLSLSSSFSVPFSSSQKAPLVLLKGKLLRALRLSAHSARKEEITCARSNNELLVYVVLSGAVLQFGSTLRRLIGLWLGAPDQSSFLWGPSNWKIKKRKREKEKQRAKRGEARQA